MLKVNNNKNTSRVLSANTEVYNGIGLFSEATDLKHN